MAVAILENGAVRTRALPITVAQYHRLFESGLLPERTELIEGVIVEKVTKTPLHSLLVRRLQDLLTPLLPPGVHLRKEEPLSLPESEPEPDLCAVQGTPEDYGRRHPAGAILVIEVAVTSIDFDRSKAAVYGRAGIQEYWLVLAEQKAIEVFSEPSRQGFGRQTTLSQTERIRVPGTSDGVVELARLFAG